MKYRNVLCQNVDLSFAEVFSAETAEIGHKARDSISNTSIRPRSLSLEVLGDSD